MQAEKRTVALTRHEWTLNSPAHHTEVEKAVAMAARERDASLRRGESPGDIVVRSEDDLVVIGFEATRPTNPKRGLEAHVAEEVGA